MFNNIFKKHKEKSILKKKENLNKVYNEKKELYKIVNENILYISSTINMLHSNENISKSSRGETILYRRQIKKKIEWYKKKLLEEKVWLKKLEDEISNLKIEMNNTYSLS